MDFKDKALNGEAYPSDLAQRIVSAIEDTLVSNKAALGMKVSQLLRLVATDTNRIAFPEELLNPDNAAALNNVRAKIDKAIGLIRAKFEAEKEEPYRLKAEEYARDFSTVLGVNIIVRKGENNFPHTHFLDLQIPYKSDQVNNILALRDGAELLKVDFPINHSQNYFVASETREFERNAALSVEDIMAFDRVHGKGSLLALLTATKAKQKNGADAGTYTYEHDIPDDEDPVPRAPKKEGIGDNLSKHKITAGVGATAFAAGTALLLNGLSSGKKQPTEPENDEQPAPQKSFLMRAASVVLGATISLMGVGAAIYAARGGKEKAGSTNLIKFVVRGPDVAGPTPS